MLTYVGPDGRRQDVLEGEAVKRRVLEGLGWRCETPQVGPDPEDVEDVAVNLEPLLAVDGIGPEIAGALAQMGITSLDGLRAATDGQLLGVPGINARRLKRIRQALARD